MGRQGQTGDRQGIHRTDRGQAGLSRTRTALTVAAQGSFPHRLPAQVAPSPARQPRGEAMPAAALGGIPRCPEDAPHVGQQPRGSPAPPQPPRSPGPAGAPRGAAARGRGARRPPAHGAGLGGRQREGARPHGRRCHGLGEASTGQRRRLGPAGREETRRGWHRERPRGDPPSLPPPLRGSGRFALAAPGGCLPAPRFGIPRVCAGNVPAAACPRESPLDSHPRAAHDAQTEVFPQFCPTRFVAALSPQELQGPGRDTWGKAPVPSAGTARLRELQELIPPAEAPVLVGNVEGKISKKS